MLEFLLLPEWIFPIATAFGLGIAKLYSIFKKADNKQIDKFKAIGGIETELREDLMERLKQTEDRLDKLMLTTAALTVKVSAQSEKIIQLEQQLKKYKTTNRTLSTQMQKIVTFVKEHECDCGDPECSNIMELIRVSNI